MKAIVHIGTEKTGTTSIQEFLYQNRKKLSVAGFHFLQSAGKRNNRAIPAYCLGETSRDDYFRSHGIRTQQERQAFKKKFLKTFDAEIKTLPQHITTVIISSEHFHSRITTDSEINNLSKFFSGYFDEVKIVCYLREQATTCQSYYSTILRNGGTQSFSEFLEKHCEPQNIYFNYNAMLTNWARYFGVESLDISLFFRERFLNGNLLDDFTAKIDPALIGTLSKTAEIQNQSLTPFGQALSRAVNMIFPMHTSPSEDTAIRDRCKEIIRHRLPGTGQQPSSEERMSIYSSFIESNTLVQQKFFPTVNPLFESPDEVVVPRVSIDQADLDVLIAVLDLIAKQGRDQFLESGYGRVCTFFFSCINEITNLAISTDDKNEKEDNALFMENCGYSLRELALRVERRDVRLAHILMNLADRMGLDAPDVTDKLIEYKKRIASPLIPKFMFMYRPAANLSELQKKELGEKLRPWVLALPVPVGAFFTPIESTKVLASESALYEGASVSYDGYSLIEANSVAEACAIAKRCPLIAFGGKVEVLQLASVGD